MIQFALDGVLGEKEHENIQKYLKEEKNSAVHALDSMSDRIKKAYEASKKGRKQ